MIVTVGCGLRFTRDGLRLQATEYYDAMLHTYDAVTGASLSHVQVKRPNKGTSGILVHDSGSYAITICNGVAFLDANGATTRTVTPGGDGFRPWSLAYSPLLGGVIMKEAACTARVVLLREAWCTSLRRVWITACVAVLRCNVMYYAVFTATTTQSFTALRIELISGREITSLPEWAAGKWTVTTGGGFAWKLAATTLSCSCSPLLWLSNHH